MGSITGGSGGATALPDLHVGRPGLIERLLSHRCAVIEAGAGFGKSTLAIEYVVAGARTTLYVALNDADRDADGLTASLRRELRAAGWSDLAATMDAESPERRIEALLDMLAGVSAPMSIVLDDAHHLLDDASRAVLRLVQQLPTPHRLLVAARRLPNVLDSLRTDPTVAFLGTTELTLTHAEIQSLVVQRWATAASDQVVDVLREMTGGWVTAIVLALSAGQPQATGDATSMEVAPGSGIAPLLEPLLQRLDTADRDCVVELAHLPLLSAEVADAVRGADGTFGRLVAAGIPLSRTAAGWWELPGPVVGALQSRGPLVAASALAASEVYERSGQAAAAIRLLIRSGQSEPAAGALGRLSPAETEDLGFAVVNDLIAGLSGDVAQSHPRLLLALARLAEASHRNDVRSALLRRVGDALDSMDTADRDRVRRELDAEFARDLVWDERTRGDAKLVARSVLDAAGDDELLARARALDLLGRLASWFSDSGPQPEAERLLTESARLSRLLGHRTWTAQALTALAMGYYLAICRFDSALETLDDALADLPARSGYRAMVQTLRADLLTEMGRRDEAEASIAEMRAIGRARREEWILAYAAWSEMTLASYADDPARAVAAATEVERHRDVWFDQASGVEFLVQAADSMARVGEPERARRYLDRAMSRRSAIEKIASFYEAAVLARGDDPELAIGCIESTLGRGDLDPHERWPLFLMRALAAHRAGDPTAGGLAAAAYQLAADLGHPQGPEIREPRANRALLPLAAAAGSVAATVLQSDMDRLAITALGGFEVRRGRESIALPAGRPAMAVRAVVAAGGRLRSDALIEILWPETAPDVGRNRMRNLLSRLHSAVGAVLVRDGESITLPDGAEVDAIRFEAEARDAIGGSADPHRVIARARSAVQRYRGDLLPDDVDQLWAAAYRDRLRLRYLDVLDLLATDALDRGEVDEAIRLTQRAIDAETHDEQRYLRLAEMLIAQGRFGTARSVLARLRAALADLDLAPPARYGELQVLLQPGG